MVEEESSQRLRVVANTALHTVSKEGIGDLVGPTAPFDYDRTILETQSEPFWMSKEKIPDPKMGRSRPNGPYRPKFDRVKLG
jgi:hypothetical protein